MTDASKNTEKTAWSGRIIAVQPRIRLTRSFDERYHSYQGYVLRIGIRQRAFTFPWSCAEQVEAPYRGWKDLHL